MSDPVRPEARFFRTRAALRAWFERHHSTSTELWIAYPKKGVPRKAVSCPEAVEEALCFGWVDGQVRSLDAHSYANRYTPRRPDSRWSRVNVRTATELRRAGRMRPSGVAAFERRGSADRAGYSYEERPTRLPPALARRFRERKAAWDFFRAQPPSYRTTCTFWVTSATRDETRRRRLEVVIEASALGRRIDLLSPRAIRGRSQRTRASPTGKRTRAVDRRPLARNGS